MSYGTVSKIKLNVDFIMTTKIMYIQYKTSALPKFYCYVYLCTFIYVKMDLDSRRNVTEETIIDFHLRHEL